jgi:mitochondrial chaperone BCS1
MEALFPAVQGIIGDVLGSLSPLQTSDNVNTTASNPELPSMQISSLPKNLISIITMLLSVSALRDWLKLIVIGGVLESCRRMAYQLYNNFINSFFITATFREDDDSYGKSH